MSNNHSTFTELPVQLEWTLVALLAYVAYVFPHTSHTASYMTALCGAIILNGWISSRAGTAFYNDMLIFLDVAILCIYYLMLNALLAEAKAVPPIFWIYSAVLAFSYSLWDLFILKKAAPARRSQYILYIVLLVSITIGHLFLSYLTRNKSWGETNISLVGGLSWIVVLLLWHFDKWRVTRNAQRANS